MTRLIPAPNSAPALAPLALANVGLTLLVMLWLGRK
jgi:hypothetical protein